MSVFGETGLWRKEFCMKTKRFSVGQIVAVLKEAETGTGIALIPASA
jgi:hypothetical protein